MASRNVKYKDILIKKYELVHEIKKKKKKPDQVRLCHFKKLEDEDFPFLPLVLSGCQAGTLSHNTHMITHTHTWGKYYECSTNHHIKAHHHISRSIQLQNLRLFIRRAFQMLQDTKDSELFDFLSLSSVERSFSSSPTSLRWKYVISLVVLKWRIVQCCSIDHRLDSWW